MTGLEPLMIGLVLLTAGLSHLALRWLVKKMSRRGIVLCITLLTAGAGLAALDFSQPWVFPAVIGTLVGGLIAVEAAV